MEQYPWCNDSSRSSPTSTRKLKPLLLLIRSYTRPRSCSRSRYRYGSYSRIFPGVLCMCPTVGLGPGVLRPMQSYITCSSVVRQQVLVALPAAGAPAPACDYTLHERQWQVNCRCSCAVLLHGLPVWAKGAVWLALEDVFAAAWAVPRGPATAVPPLVHKAPSKAPALLGTRAELHPTQIAVD